MNVEEICSTLGLNVVVSSDPYVLGTQSQRLNRWATPSDREYAEQNGQLPPNLGPGRPRQWAFDCAFCGKG